MSDTIWMNRWSPSIKSMRVAIINQLAKGLDDAIMTDSPTPELPNDDDEPDFDDEDGFDEADFGWDEDDE